MLLVSMGIVDPSSSIPALPLKDETVHSRHDAKQTVKTDILLKNNISKSNANKHKCGVVFLSSINYKHKKTTIFKMYKQLN